ncbi:hypothetical protein DV736_g1490, partial [Chaetothyriales sp. CBS 134916]
MWSLAAHDADKCITIANLCVSYRMLELDQGHATDQYQLLITSWMDANVARLVKTLSSKGDCSSFAKPERMRNVTRGSAAWFGGEDRRRPAHVKDREPMLDEIIMRRNVDGGPTA